MIPDDWLEGFDGTTYTIILIRPMHLSFRKPYSKYITIKHISFICK